MGRVLETLALVAILIAPTGAIAGYAYKDSEGRKWLDLNDTTGYSWLEIAAACDPVTGQCSGKLEHLNLNRYVWASQLDVRDLFAEIAGVNPPCIGDWSGDVCSFMESRIYVEDYPGDTIFGPVFSAFPMTHPGDAYGTRIIQGWTRSIYRDPQYPSYAYPVYAFVQDAGPGCEEYGVFVYCDHTFDYDGIFEGDWTSFSTSSPWMGAFLFKQVPEPGSLGLLAAGLLALGFTRRRAVA